MFLFEMACANLDVFEAPEYGFGIQCPNPKPIACLPNWEVGIRFRVRVWTGLNLDVEERKEGGAKIRD